MSTNGLDERLTTAISLRQSGDAAAAKALLLELQLENPDDARVNLQCAWVHDRLGLEREAVPFYETAIDLGLDAADLEDALLGLGSTYRTLGRYPEALATLDRAVNEFPDNRGLQVFRAMALHNNGRGKEACELLLTLLAATTSDDDIAGYRQAIDIYAEDLDRVWS